MPKNYSFKRLLSPWKKFSSWRYKKRISKYNKLLETMPEEYKPQVWQKDSPYKEYWGPDKYDKIS